jgi:IS5 family transposase
VRPRGEERTQRTQGKRARRLVVEVAHSWFTRFRKLLVRYEKLHRSDLALTMLAAAIISFRHVPVKANIIYG